MADQLHVCARWYARHGWSVFPIHSVRAGNCSCGKSACDNVAKHPRTPRGLKDATTDPATIDAWWQRWPDANIAIRTGAPPPEIEGVGVWVLDIDPRHGGDKSLAELIEKHGPLPKTVEAMTGGGGIHYVFAMPPNAEIRNKTNLIPGVDVRGAGGYIVVAPSVHSSGNTYAWKDGCSPRDIAAAEAPKWLLSLASKPAEVEQDEIVPAPPGVVARLQEKWNASQKSQPPEDSVLEAARRFIAKCDRVAEGQRNSAAFRIAGHLHAFTHEQTGSTLTEPEALELIRGWNQGNTPPLADEELSKAVKSAFAGNGTPRTPHVVKAKAPSPHSAAQPSRSSALSWKPFPLEVLPAPLKTFITSGGEAIGCDPSYVALPVLAVVASLIGNKRRVALKQSWSELAVLWVAIIGDSGTMKTPAFKLAMKALRDLQSSAMARYEERLAVYEADLQQYEKAFGEWKRSRKSSSEPPPKPQPPDAERFIVADLTVEAVAPILKANPNGVLLARDEISGWFGSFDRYSASGKGGGDSAHWLSTFNGESMLVDRKTGPTKVINVPSAVVSVCGGVQPGILRRLLSEEHKESGLAARLLFAHPPRKPKRWTEADLSEDVERSWADLLVRLIELNPNYDANGQPVPVLLPLTGEGKAAWIDFYNEHANEHADLTGELSAAWSKLEGYAARFALIIHVIRQVTADPTLEHPGSIDEVSVAAGVTLSRWFGHEAKRVYAMLGEPEELRHHRRLVELIERKGGEVTVREWQRSRPNGSSEDAEAELDELVKAGLGRWDLSPSPSGGGHQVRRFRLTDSTDTDSRPENPEKIERVSVSEVSDPRKSTPRQSPQASATDRGAA